MVLPARVNKASGLRRALAELGLDPSDVVGIGDAENDRDFLHACGCAVAVANALPSVKSSVHVVTTGAHGAGLTEIIDRMLADDLLISNNTRGQNLFKPH
jgi:hydroxymethylpyrimidine pyrophosphatase-like HAD family hydrolase